MGTRVHALLTHPTSSILKLNEKFNSWSRVHGYMVTQPTSSIFKLHYSKSNIRSTKERVSTPTPNEPQDMNTVHTKKGGVPGTTPNEPQIQARYTVHKKRWCTRPELRAH